MPTRDPYALILQTAIRRNLARKIALQVKARMANGDLTLEEAGLEFVLALDQIDRWRLGRPLPAWVGHKG